MANIYEAFNESTLHALPIAVTSKSLLSRVFWLVVFFLSTAALIYNGSQLIDRYQMGDVATSVTMDTSNSLVPMIYLYLNGNANTVIISN